MINEFETYDGEKIFYKRWQAENEVAIIQIAHGLGEMSDYYEEFAKLANEKHITVYLNEARGHGRTKARFNKDNIIEQYVKDIYEQNRQIRKIHTYKPVFILGHSLGTLVGQSAILQYPNIWDGLILIGIPYYENILELIDGITKEIAENGESAESVSTFLKMFSSINDSFSKEEGVLAWLTSDEERRNYYISLPYTNISYSNRFYKEFLEKSEEVQGKGIEIYSDKTFPIFILGGGCDVISKDGTYGKIKAEQLQDRDFTNVQVKIYLKLRHSILQERDRTQVVDDILKWVKTTNGIVASSTK